VDDPINTFNLYFKPSDGTIRSYNPDTGLSIIRGDFNPDMDYLSLDTDGEKQGWEYLVYTLGQDIYVMEYDRDTRARITRIGRFTGTICGLRRQQMVSPRSFETNDNPRILLDRKRIVVAIRQGGTCSSTTNLYYEISFDIQETVSESEIIRREINASNVLGDVVIDYNFVDEENGGLNSDKGRWGFLGYDRDGQQLVLRDNDYSVLWETTLADIESIQQVTSSLAIVQTRTRIYVLNIPELFSLAEQNEEDPILGQSRIAALFDFADYTLIDDNDPEFFFGRYEGNNNSFVVENEDALSLRKDGMTTELLEKDNALFTLDYTLMDNGTLLAIKRFSNTQILVKVDPDSAVATTLVEADLIALKPKDEEIFINTLHRQNSFGFEAHWVDSFGTLTSYGNSQFVFSDDLRNQGNRITLLSSDAVLQEYPLTAPSLYVFDDTETNGRLRFIDPSDVNSNIESEFSFGTLNGDLLSVQSATTVNDELAFLKVNTDSAGDNYQDLYFYDPRDLLDDSVLNSAEKSAEQSEDEVDSMALIDRVEL